MTSTLLGGREVTAITRERKKKKLSCEFAFFRVALSLHEVSSSSRTLAAGNTQDSVRIAEEDMLLCAFAFACVTFD